MKTMTKPPPPNPWHGVRELLRARGLRWTPQRRSLIDVLARSEGHLSGAEILRRCREADPLTTPSTVYRTLDVLEELGYLHHSHGADGREEYHVLPETEHAHLRCLGARREAPREPGVRGGAHARLDRRSVPRLRP
jgi:Fur family ferric uptake transcriptional regulator